MKYNITIAFKDLSTKEYLFVQDYNLTEDALSLKSAAGSIVVIFKEAMNGFSVSEVE